MRRGAGCGDRVARRNAVSVALLVFLFSFAAAASPLIARFVTPTPFTVIYMIMPVAYLAVVLSVPSLRSSLGWLRVGQFTPFLWTALAVLAILSVIGLILYFVTIRPDLSHQPVIGSSRMNPAALFAVGIGIAVLNAAVEESMYRGILMNALDAALGGGMLPIVLQAIAFGSFHFNSTEPGVSGVLITALLGLVLGWLRRVGRGMLPPYIVHVLVDIGVWTLGMLQTA